MQAFVLITLQATLHAQRHTTTPPAWPALRTQPRRLQRPTLNAQPSRRTHSRATCLARGFPHRESIGDSLSAKKSICGHAESRKTPASNGAGTGASERVGHTYACSRGVRAHVMRPPCIEASIRRRIILCMAYDILHGSPVARHCVWRPGMGEYMKAPAREARGLLHLGLPQGAQRGGTGQGGLAEEAGSPGLSSELGTFSGEEKHRQLPPRGRLHARRAPTRLMWGRQLPPQARCGRHLPPVKSAAGAGCTGIVWELYDRESPSV